MDKKILGMRLCEARQHKNYSRKVIAEKAEISNVYLYEIEHGIKTPSLNTLIKIIDALDVSADYLLRDELTTGPWYEYEDLSQRLKALTPQQRKTATDILDAYIRSL